MAVKKQETEESQVKVPLSQAKENPNPSLLLSHEELLELDRIIDQLPTLYGKQFLLFFSLIHQKRNLEQQSLKLRNDESKK